MSVQFACLSLLVLPLCAQSQLLFLGSRGWDFNSFCQTRLILRVNGRYARGGRSKALFA